MSRYAIPNTVLTQKLGDEMVLLDLAGEGYFSLNEVGTRVWQLLAQGQSAGQIQAVLEADYDVAPEQLEKDIGELIAQLLEQGLLVEQGGG